MEAVQKAPQKAPVATPAAPPKIRTRKKILTYEDYARLTPPDSGNYELHDGKIIFMASPTPAHQRIAKRIAFALDSYVEKNKLGEIFIAPLDTKLDMINIFQPDVLFIAANRANTISDKKIDGAPDLVLEVQSEGNTAKEMSYKKYIYESSGVREYWLVNLKKNTLTQYINYDGEFIPKGIWQKNDTLRAEVIPGFEIALDTILE